MQLSLGHHMHAGFLTRLLPIVHDHDGGYSRGLSCSFASAPVGLYIVSFHSPVSFRFNFIPRARVYIHVTARWPAPGCVRASVCLRPREPRSGIAYVYIRERPASPSPPPPRPVRHQGNRVSE